jgi:hypothetical protein
MPVYKRGQYPIASFGFGSAKLAQQIEYANECLIISKKMQNGYWIRLLASNKVLPCAVWRA